MGNCQTVDAAALVIQHPNGKQERLYEPVSASEVMKMNPGHYVSLIIPIPISGDGQLQDNHPDGNNRGVQITRVKLLRPSDTLVLGRAYRLITTQEVMKVLRAKKYAKMRKDLSESGEILQRGDEEGKCRFEKNSLQAKRPEGHHQMRSRSANFTAGRSIPWKPSLQSISET